MGWSGNGKKKVLLFLAGTGVLALVVIATLGGSVADDEGAVLLGHCPTMEVVASSIAMKNKNIILVGLSSSVEVLERLRSGSIDIALIGRVAKDYERGPAEERVIGKGYTLVSTTRRFIQETSLTGMSVHTAVDAGSAHGLLPGAMLRFYPTHESAIANGLEEAVLIRWDDFDDEYELVVVFDGDEKVEHFRIPVLYSINHPLDGLRVTATNEREGVS